MENWSIQYSWLIPLLPLIGAAIAGFFGAKWLKGQSHWPIWLGVGASAAISISMLVYMLGESHHAGEGTLGVSRLLYTWIQAGNFHIYAGFWLDPLSAVMLCVVCGIGFFITVFAAGYMKGEAGYFRFFAYLGLFIFAMTCLVMGENLIMLYLGWEGVGLCSYLLIGYYYERPSAREAAKKAFLVNRIGDFGFGIGIMLCYAVFGTVSYFGDGVGTNTGLLELAMHPLASQQWAMQWIPFLLMIGAFGKSAQFPLYVWLPDAMEGPTPVSALIHAATMVTAGVYMIARCGTLFVGNNAAMMTIAVVGGFTAIFAASIALRQFDLKKVFAYSTISQLGFMFVAVGVLAPVAGVFHLITHAFFKALLFLSSGVVMHAMQGELDMRKMSGLKRVLPKTRWLMLIGCLALAGFPFLAGFFSKDEIVALAWERSPILGLLLLFTAFVTAYYTFRLYFQVFEGPEVIPPAPDGGHGHGADDAHHDDVHPHDSHGHDDHGTKSHDSHGDHGHHNHEPALMILPLVVLALGAILAGYINWPEHGLGHFLSHSPSLKLAYEQAKAHKEEAGHEVNPNAFGQPDDRGEEIEHAEHATHITFMIVSAFVAVGGIFLAYLMHLKDRAAAERLAARFGGLTRAIEAKYWVDEIYQAAIVEPLRTLGKVFFWIDRNLVDMAVNIVGFVPSLGGFGLKLGTQQHGRLQGYAATMLFGLMVILAIVFL